MGGSKEIKPTAVDPVSPQTRGMSNDLISYSKSLFDRGPNQVVPMTSAEQTGIDALTGTLTNNPMTMAEPLLSNILSGKRLSPDTNPYLAGTISGLRTEADKTLGSNMNLLDTMFGKSGMVNGSGRSLEATNLAEKSSSDLNTTIANMLSSLYSQGQSEQMSALGMLPSYQTSNVNSILSALSGLSLPRTLDQQQQQYDYSSLGDNALLLSQILGSQPGLNYVTPEYQPSDTMQYLSALGPLMQGSGALIGAF
jgi:hypothetical protein